MTDECNLCCTYCRGKLFTMEDDTAGVEIDEDIPTEIEYPLPDLYRFIASDPDPVITFIGGEPLLRPGLISEVMRDAPAERFMIQTNGLLLDRLPAETVSRFETVLISIDGDRETTDRHRGAGTYDRVLAMASLARERGFSGELIARMTVSEDTDIFRAVTHLADGCGGVFDAVHWQIDAAFSPDFHLRRFSEWSQGYNDGISRLVEYWVSEMGLGRVRRWYPFLDCMEDLLLGRTSLLRCGSGHANYTVLPNGRIVPCPVMVGMKEYYLGTLTDSRPENLPVVEVPGPCRDCDIVSLCGGRCLYSWVVRPWPPEGSDLVCGTVRHLFSALQAQRPAVGRLIGEGTIRLADFSHTRYNGCEIIP